MSSVRWQFILCEWLKKTELIEATTALRQINIVEFYEKFREKVKSVSSRVLPVNLRDFLSENFPNFEILHNEDDQISPEDFVFIFSLILYYCCVFRVIDAFQKCCTSLDDKHQPVVCKFLASLRDGDSINKELVSAAIKSASPQSPPQWNFITSSPIRTPDKQPQSTPLKISHEKLMELQRTKTSLDNERYERNMVEAELKDAEDKINQLLKEQKSLKQQVQKLQNELVVAKESETLSPNKAIRDEQVRQRLQREIDSREDQILSLRCEIEELSAQNVKKSTRNQILEQELKVVRSKCGELEEISEALREVVEEKKRKIEFLEETNSDLQRFIEEARNTSADKDSSSDNLNQTRENLGCVIDVLLKEKEQEVEELKAENHSLKGKLVVTLEEVNKLSDFAAKIEILTHQLTTEKSELKTAKKLLDEKSQKILELETEKKVLTSAVHSNAQIKVDRDVLETQYNLIAKRHEESEKKLSLKIDEILVLASEKSKKDAEVTELLGKLQSAEEKVENQADSIEKLKLNLLQEKDSKTDLNQKLAQLQLEISEKESTILEMVTQIDELKVFYREQVNGLEQKLAKGTDESSRIQELLAKIGKQEEFEEKVKKLEQSHLQEKIFNDKLNGDFQILHAKLMKSRHDYEELEKSFSKEREKFEAEKSELQKKCEEEVKETRLEMEGKLEKMKEKMKSLYTEEVTKKTIKYEEKLKELSEDLKLQAEKTTRLELHNEKLTKECFVVKQLKLSNDELKRENEFVRSKLRFMEMNGGMQTTGSIGMARKQTTMTHFNGASIGMEDEEGEEFNNTYLDNMKTGGSLMDLAPYSASELQKRNSLYPSHMRSSYVIHGMDRTVSEQDMKDGGVVLDDSQTALLQNGGNRKKQSTSYKKPGPPTPSKQSGRLSIGGELNYKNILKESNENNENISKKTPRRFNLFGPSKVKDELKRSRRTLTPKRLKSGSEFVIDENEDDFLPAGNYRKKEELRKEQRNQARDQNRPNYAEEKFSSPELEKLTLTHDDSDEWGDEEETQQSKRNSRDLNNSLTSIVNQEEWHRKQRRARKSSFNRNRRRSSTDEWSRFQSCWSIGSVDQDSSHEIHKKSHTGNFLNFQHAEVNRISDIYVDSSRRSTALAAAETEKPSSNFFGIFLGFSICLMIFSIKSFNQTESKNEL